MEVTHPLQLLSRRLGMPYGLGPKKDWEQALAALPMNIVQFERGSDVLREGDRPDRACIMIKGFTCWSKATAKGRRQILSFSVPGDMPDLTTRRSTCDASTAH